MPTTGRWIAVLGIVAASLLDRGSAARAQPAPIEGRVLDEGGKPLGGATVRLYRRDGRWGAPDPLVESVQAAPDGGFRLAATPLPPGPPVRWGMPELVLIADHPGHAVGWRTLPRGPSWRGEVRLSRDRAGRTITVVDEAGRPLAGASVFVTSLGDPESPSPWLRDYLSLQPADGPLTATTDGAGRARFPDLPRTPATFAAGQPGRAENVCYQGEVIHLAPAATLEGTLTGPAGRPLPGVTIRLMAGFIHGFRVARTDAQGHYRFDALPARGWDRSERHLGTAGDGSYKLWLDGDEFAIPTQLVTLEPNERRTLDLRAESAGVIRVTVVEEGTGKRVAGVGVSGTDRETGNFVRFHAATEADGVARIACAPASLTLTLDGPPEGMFNDREAWRKLGDGWQGDFAGGVLDLTLTLPRIGGRVAAIEGRCVGPADTAVARVKVYAASEPTDPTVYFGFIRASRVDDEGGFSLDRVPLGRSLGVYAITEDGKFGVYRSFKLDEPAAPIRLDLRPTVSAEFTLQDEAGKPHPLHPVRITVGPKFGDDRPLAKREIRSDAAGRVRVDRVIPGLTYHVSEEPTLRPGPRAGLAKMEAPALDADLILAPE